MRKEFERTTPELVGIRSTDILEYIDALEHSPTEMHGIMIMRHGKICAEGWWAPYGPNLRHGLQSHTKTYAATAVGIAYTEGILKLNERLIDIFPNESPAEPGENLKKLTIRDVLCMGCGMDTMPFDSENWIREFMHTPVNHVPGTTYMYNSTGSTMLGAIVRKKTGLGLHEYLTPRLFHKIGIDPENLRWICMMDGMEMGGGGLFATTEDNLRLMKLYADGGVWEDERILAEDYVELATTNQNDSHTESKNNPEATDNFLGYGFQIWMCKPRGVYRADGAMGQFTIVCPGQDMIIAINETASGAHWAQNTLNITWGFLEKIGVGEVTEDSVSQDALIRKMRSLNTPNPTCSPYSAKIPQINGRAFKVARGILTPENYNFMFGKLPKGAQSFSLSFDNYGCVWNLNYTSGETESIRVTTNGTRFTNLMGKPEDMTQLLVTDGTWMEDDTFVINCRWAETCITKRLSFKFTSAGAEIREDSNSPFERPADGKEPILAELEE